MARKPGITTIQFDGAFFAKDVRKTFRQNARALMDRVAEVGETEVKRRIAAAPRRSPGPSYSGGYVRGRRKSLSGKPWSLTAVISADTTGLSRRDAIRVQAALAGRRKDVGSNGRRIGTMPGHEGNAKVFARTKTGLGRLTRETIADLTKGLE